MPSSYRTSFPHGVPCFVDTTQPDIAAARDFYGGLFGWAFEERAPGYHAATLDGGDVGGLGAGERAAWNTYIAVDDIEAAVSRAETAGGSTIEPPADFGGVGLVAFIAAPDGAVLGLWQETGYAGSQVVNAPGSWNWSNWHTPDPAGAAAFGAAVFGWEPRTVDYGGGYTATMLCVPGYGDHLAERDPQLRERHAAGGAPEGFADAVAWIEPNESAPPHWHVTFTCADTDATVARAYELGAEVVVPPFDGGPVRMAVLRDPQGAAFSVNTYTGPGAEAGADAEVGAAG